MQRSKASVPVILLLDDGSSADSDCVRSWLLNSRFQTSEACDIFSVIEEMSDFTLPNRPDVIYLNVKSEASDVTSIRSMMAAFCQSEPSIISMTSQKASTLTGMHYAGDLDQIEARLERLIPKRPAVCN